MASLLIVQEYVPAYREAFFTKLIQNLKAEGIKCKVAAAKPRGHQLSRGDAITPRWVVPYTQKQLHVAGRTLTLGGSRRHWESCDGIIVGHLGSSLETYEALVRGLRGRVKVGLWGHIKSYVNDGHPIDLALERWQLRHADHVFAYTQSGQEYAIASGADARKVTAVMNATDTSRLERARENLSDADVRAFMACHGLEDRKTLAYIGGLDQSKRIDFLAIALDKLWEHDPRIRILVGGQGAASGLLDRAKDRGQAVLLGYVQAEHQAMIARCASALINPGRVGLVAVDALVLRIPIITTNWAYHAPEAEYLHEGVSRFTSEDDPGSFSRKIIDFLNCASDVETNSFNWEYPTLPQMVENFSAGVKKMMHN